MSDNLFPCFLSVDLLPLFFEVLSEEESVDCLDDSEASENISDDDDELSEKSGSDGIFIVSVKSDI